MRQKENSPLMKKRAKKLLKIESATAGRKFFASFLQKRSPSLALVSLALAAVPARAQYRMPIQHFPTIDMNKEPLSGNQPVTFQADSVTYDKTEGLVTADGHVEAWQNDHVLRADRVTFDRNTNVAAAYGHVVIVEPEGQVLFADYAELSQGMKQGVLTGMRALMQENAKLAGNGARRVDGKLNILSRGVYSACDVCAKHPDYAPLWQIRANSIVQDLEHKRIEYKDAYLDAYGFPVFYLPYFSMSDPSVKRQSGLLAPSIGASDRYLGSFIRVPYYFVLNDQSDVIVTTTVGTDQGPQVEALYKRDFNNGALRLDGAIARDNGNTPAIGNTPGSPGRGGSLAGYFFGHGLFNYNDTWRYGFDVNLGSSVSYLRDFQVPGYGSNLLASNAFIEGFGIGSYAKLDVRAYQGLNADISQNLLPYVLPRYQYSYFGQPDALGGRLSIDTTEFNVLRDLGTNDQQAAARIEWNRPATGLLGDKWLFTLQGAGVAYNATSLNAQPNYHDYGHSSGVTGHAQVAMRLNWPFVRDAGSWGTQIIEPIVQVIAAPQHGNSLRDRVPNEDSLNYEFTDATLFQLNRFGGYDRYDGGVRVNAGLRGEWNFSGGQKLEGLVGASYQQHIDRNLYPLFQPWNGFETGKRLSDIVGRIGYYPNKWIDFTARTRVDHASGNVRFADGTTSFGVPLLRVNFGYIYSSTNPYQLYLQNINLPGYFNPLNPNPFINGVPISFFTPRQEASLGASSHIGAYSISVGATRDIQTGHLVNVNGDVKWENECLIFDVFGGRRYTSIAGDAGDTTILFTITLKTIGGFGVNG